MHVFEAWKVAISSLWSNKLRAALTLIGVIIGVTTVIAVVSVIDGLDKSVSSTIAAMGPATFFVDKFGLIFSEDEYFEALKRKDLTIRDMEAIEKHCPLVDLVGASSAEWNITAKYGSEKVSGVVFKGVTSNIIEITDLTVPQGRSLSEYDDKHRRAVAVIGPDLADGLFGPLDPIGKQIKIRGRFFEVIGVGNRRGSMLGVNQDNWAIIPLSVFEKYFQGRRYRTLTIFCRAVSVDKLEEAQDEVRTVLRSRRHVKYNDPDDFSMMTSGTFLELYRNFTRGAFFAMIGISSIALVVGGIVIMNIMLVTVTERTREIGIRKAAGARRRDILWQFLIEASTLSSVGGAIGIGAGIGFALLVANTTPLPAAVNPLSMVAGVVLALVVGIAFGLFPAVKAARLDPVDSLRYE